MSLGLGLWCVPQLRATQQNNKEVKGGDLEKRMGGQQRECVMCQS